MTAETEIGRGREALAVARAWRAIELSPDLRRGVEAAARAAGVEPAAWLTRTVLAAAVTPAEPGPPAETPPQTALAERPSGGPAQQLPPLVRTSPRSVRGTLVLALLAIVVVAFGAGAYYLRYAGAPSGAEPALTAAPPHTDGNAPALEAAKALPESPSTPAPAADPSTAATQSAQNPPSAAEPAVAPSTPPVPALPLADAVAPSKPQPAPAFSAPPPAGPPLPAPPPDAQSAAAVPAPPPPPTASAAAALPPGVGPRVQPPPLSPQVVLDTYSLGVRYAFGTGVKQDYKKAAELFQKAAVQGLADAQYNLGALYDSGLGVAKDPVRAVIWYHSAAEQNHPSAQLNLGLAYANGTGVAQDYGEAARWFRRAADQGVVTAQYNLAALYANGRGVEQSHVDAYAWFNIAAASGDLEARDQMRRAAETMSPQQLKAAHALAIKLAEGVKRPVPASVPGPANSPGENPQTASTKPAANAEAAPAAAAQPGSRAPPIDQAQLAEIQRDLARLQFDPGPSDGVLNDQTAEAIRRYQADRKLKVDGEASRALLFRLKTEVERLQKP